MKDIAIEILEIWMKEALQSKDFDRLQRMQIYWQILKTNQTRIN